MYFNLKTKVQFRQNVAALLRVAVLFFMSAAVGVGLSVCMGLSFQAAAQPAEDPLKQLSTIFKKWQKSPLVKAKIKKTLSSEFLAQPKVTEGSIYTSKGRLRLETKGPSLIVVLENDIWQEERVGDFIQVNHSQAKNIKKSSGLLALLFGDQNIWSELVVEKEETKKDHVQFSLEPMTVKNWPVKNLKIVVNTKTNSLVSLRFKDELDSQLLYEFSRIRFSSKIDEKLFAYKPPAGAEVNHF